MTMILYHCMSARSFRPLWMLEELGLPYELKMLPFPPRVKAPTYLEINPLGTIPAFFDGTTRMTESAAICHFLAARHSPGRLNVETDEPGFGAYLRAYWERLQQREAFKRALDTQERAAIAQNVEPIHVANVVGPF